MPLSTHETKAAAAQQEQQHQHAADVHFTLTDKAITNCLAMSEREKENQHRWLKMQAKHAAIQVRLETLIIETNRGGSHPTPTKRGGRTAGGEVRRDYYISASANLTATQQSVWGEFGEKRGGGRPEAPSANKPETGLFLGE